MRVVGKDDAGDKQTRYFSETLLSGIRVLAVDQAIENIKGKVSVAKTATVEASSKQVEIISLALRMGDLSLSLQSLAPREEGDKLAGMSHNIGATGAPANADPIDAAYTLVSEEEKSYTLDTDIYYMQDDYFSQKRNNAKGGGFKINVLRGAKAEEVAY